MVKIKRKLIIGIILLLAFAAVVNAKVQDVCVAVQDQSSVEIGTEWDCFDISVSENSVNITTLLEESKFDYLIPNGTLCSVNGLGSCPNDEIKVYIANSKWELISDLSKRVVADEDVVVFVFGDSGLEDGSVPEMLTVEKITAYIDGDKETLDIDGDSFKVEPGSKVEIKIEFRNVYDDKTDTKIEDVIVTGIIDGIDDGDELEEESDAIDLDTEKKKTVTLTFDIPLLVEEDSFGLELQIEGEDEKGISYDYVLDGFEVTVDKESHKLLFKQAELSKESVECDRSLSLLTDIVNIGSKDEDVELTVKNEELKINYKDEFELEEGTDEDDSEYKKTISLNIPEDAKAGTYPIQIKATYNSKSITETINLLVKSCVKETTPPKEEEEVIVDILPKEEKKEEEITGGVVVAEPTEKEPSLSERLLEGPLFIALIVGADLLIIIIGIALIAALIRRK